MTRENRINTIVVLVVLALMLPGGVILFRKKSQPGERPIGSPDPVKVSTAYMDPYPAESYKRLAPVRTLQWVAGLAYENTTGDVERISRAHDNSAVVPAIAREQRVRLSVGEAIFYTDVASGSTEAQVMSTGRRFQLISKGQSPTPWIRILLWQENVAPGSLVATVDGQPAAVLVATRHEIPKAVRHDLQDAGFVLPPGNVTVLDIAGATTQPSPRVVKLKWDDREESAELPQ